MNIFLNSNRLFNNFYNSISFNARKKSDNKTAKENKEAQIDEELKSYRDAKISAIIAKQENQLENLQNKIS